LINWAGGGGCVNGEPCNKLDRLCVDTRSLWSADVVGTMQAGV